jgi:hypothetical protein
VPAAEAEEDDGATGLEVETATGVSLSLFPVFELRLVREGKTTCEE